MAINTGVDISNLSAAAVLAPSAGVDVSNLSAAAVLTMNPGVDISNWSAAAVLKYANANPPEWNFATMPDGYLGNPYSFLWNLTPAAPPTTYSVVAGALPTGLSLASPSGDVGTISGIPAAFGVFSFTLRATNTFGSADQAFTITIVAPVVGAAGNWGFVN
jgi:hypothetical protein